MSGPPGNGSFNVDLAPVVLHSGMPCSAAQKTSARAACRASSHSLSGGGEALVSVARQIQNTFLRQRGLRERLNPVEIALVNAADGLWNPEQRSDVIVWCEQLRLLRWDSWNWRRARHQRNYRDTPGQHDAKDESRFSRRPGHNGRDTPPCPYIESVKYVLS
jgi:hypothetical protein